MHFELQKQSGRTGERKEKAKIGEEHRDMTGQREADTDEKVHEDEVQNEVGEDYFIDFYSEINIVGGEP